MTKAGEEDDPYAVILVPWYFKSVPFKYFGKQTTGLDE